MATMLMQAQVGGWGCAAATSALVMLGRVCAQAAHVHAKRLLVAGTTIRAWELAKECAF
jgi:hypothetical protein